MLLKCRCSVLNLIFQGDFFKEKFINEKFLKEKLMTETETCQAESETCKAELKQAESKECSANHNALKPRGHIGISVLRQIENARETDLCIGTSTSSGYITSKSCCEVDEMVLFDVENSETPDEIKIAENSIWIEDHICFINTTENLKFDFPSSNDGGTQVGFQIDAC